MSETAKQLIRALITDPASRLGVNGVEEIKSHPWFSDLDWNNFNTQMRPPFVPNLEGDHDTSYFPSSHSRRTKRTESTLFKLGTTTMYSS